MGALDGQCVCGQSKLSCDGPALKAVHCQCTHCQKLSGTGHLTNILVKKGSATVTGPVAIFESKADSGNTNTRTFCKNCGCQMLRQNSGMADVDIIHGGTLTNPEVIKPEAVIWHKSALSWDYNDPALPVFETMPPPA
jgi:hypothetical protein